MSVEKTSTSRDMTKEGIGWISLVGFLFLFPALFFFCVWLPMWMGYLPRFP